MLKLENIWKKPVDFFSFSDEIKAQFLIPCRNIDQHALEIKAKKKQSSGGLLLYT